MADRKLNGYAALALRQGRGILVIAFILSGLVNALRLTGPLFMILIYDRVLPARSQETLVALFVIVTTFLMAQALGDYGRKRILARFGAQFQERMEVGLFAAAGRGALFAQGRSKPVLGLDEVDNLRGFFHSTSLIAIYDFIWTPMFLLVIFVLNPLLGWVCLGGIALIGLTVAIQITFLGTRESDANAASAGISELKAMVTASRDVIRNQDMAQGYKARWLQARATSRDRAIALKDWTMWFDSVADMVVLLTRYTVLGTGAYLTLQGTLTIGAMVAATFLVSRSLIPVEKFLTELPDIFAALRNWALLKRVLHSLDEEVPDAFADEPGNPRALLSLVNVQARSVHSGDLVLKGITLDIAPGQIVQIIGPSGRGKTALAEVIMGQLKRSAGTILVNGMNPARLNDKETERLFGYLPDDPGFVAGTLAENIARLDPDMDPARVAAAARRACLHARISALPEGYQTQIDANARSLARGQRAQLALARAVYHMPKLLILDEPDAVLFDLYPKTMEKTFDQILEAGGAVLILGRKPFAIKRLTATHMLEDGRLKLVKPAGKMAVVKTEADAAVAKLIRR